MCVCMCVCAYIYTPALLSASFVYRQDGFCFKRCVSFTRALPRRTIKLLRRIFIPSVLGITLGGVVGLYGKTLVLPAETAPLGWLFLSASKLGEAAVPINLVLLGAALSRRPDSKDLPALTAVGIVLARMVIMPVSLIYYPFTPPSPSRVHPNLKTYIYVYTHIYIYICIYI